VKNVFLRDRFFWGLGISSILFLVSFTLSGIYPLAIIFLVAFAVVCIIDYFILFSNAIRLRSRRLLPKVFSLGDKNPVTIEVQNLSKLALNAFIIDEVPIELQERDFGFQLNLGSNERKRIKYEVQPNTRGSYAFGKIHFLISSFIGLLDRRISFNRETEIPVYPSIIQMKNYSLRAFDRNTPSDGLKLMRRIGHSYEFEQIKN